MASNVFPHIDGSYNKAPVFYGDDYAYCKKIMQISICSHDVNVWNLVTKLKTYISST